MNTRAVGPIWSRWSMNQAGLVPGLGLEFFVFNGRKFQENLQKYG